MSSGRLSTYSCSSFCGPTAVPPMLVLPNPLLKLGLDLVLERALVADGRRLDSDGGPCSSSTTGLKT